MSDDEQNKTKKARKNSRVTREFGTVAHPGDSVVGVRSCRDSTSRLLLAGSCFGRTVTVHFPSQASLQRQSHHISPHKPVCNGSHSIFPITSQSATAVTVYFPLTSQSTTKSLSLLLLLKNHDNKTTTTTTRMETKQQLNYNKRIHISHPHPFVVVVHL